MKPITLYHPLCFGVIVGTAFFYSMVALAHEVPEDHSHEAAQVDVDVMLYTEDTKEPVDVDVTISTEEVPQVVSPQSATALSIDRQNRIINLGRNMATHMQAAITRLEQITARMESRLKKLEAEGVDTLATREALERSKTSLSSAKDALVNADTLVVTIVSSDEPQERFNDIRKTFTEARDAIKDALAHLATALMTAKESLTAPRTTAPVPEIDPETPIETESATGTSEESIDN